MPKARTTAPGTYAAFLRGINLGSHNRLLMPALSAMFSGAGCDSVKTYIQSGNVVFRATPRLAGEIASLITAQIAKDFGYRTPVILRSKRELAAVVANNPFVKAGAPEESLHVVFLAEEPEAAMIQSLDPNRCPPDEFAVRGREVYLRLPNGTGRSKLTNQYFDSRLKTTGTVRNWRTTKGLLDLMEAIEK
jgi:uncharacterized protein (DUF1697 family)